MCGIVGFVGGKNASEIVVDGLKKLEYRGYDSWGIALHKGNGLFLKTAVGKIGEISSKSLPISSIAIGHTRWATHGAVSEKNAHPHVSMNGEIAVVHNGIIENYVELRRFLQSKGFKFNSETDTEVIPHFIEFFLAQEKNSSKPFQEKLKNSIIKTLKKLDGSYGIAVLHKNFSGLICARNGSPLVLGIGSVENEFFVASDVTAFLEHSNKAVFLNDGELAVLNNGFSVFNVSSGKPVKKKIELIQWNLEQAMKGSFPHFMQKEINEQKFSIAKSVQQDIGKIEKVSKMIKGAFGVFFVGCGTSYHACVSSSYQFAEIAKMHVNVVLASEFRNYENFLTNKTLVVAVSQSGETADVLDAVKFAKKKNAKIVSICNAMGSTLTRLSDETILMNVGPEICVLSTKTYTSQLAILLLLAFSVAGKYSEGKRLIEKTSNLVKKTIEFNEEKVKELAKKTRNAKDYFLIGRDLAFPSALEGALKIKEVSYIHAEGFAGAELKHGTIALIEQGVPCIVLSTARTRQLILSNAVEIKSRGGFIIGIDSKNSEIFDFFIQVPSVNEADPILMIIPIQLLSYYLALERGLDPDKPRNLAKSVTVR